jgi:hypothetical protein
MADAVNDARGERPVDVADRRDHRHLLGILAPEYRHDVSLEE